MRLVIHQPNFVPRLKVLQKIACADRWVILETVQYVKQEWQNRCKIVPRNEGYAFWLTLPTRLPLGSKSRIEEVTVSDHRRQLERHHVQLRCALEGLPHRAEVLDYWDEFLALVNAETLSQVSTLSTLLALRRYARTPDSVSSKEIAYTGTKSALVASICQHCGATEYIADSGSLSYLRLSDFGPDTIVRWQDWDGQANHTGLQNWRDTAFLNVLARKGANFVRDHLNDPLLVNKLEPTSLLQN